MFLSACMSATARKRYRMYKVENLAKDSQWPVLMQLRLRFFILKIKLIKSQLKTHLKITDNGIFLFSPICEN